MILIFTNFFLKINVSINFTKFFFKVVGVQRNQPAEEVIEEVDTVDRGGNKDFRNFFKFSPKNNKILSVKNY